MGGRFRLVRALGAGGMGEVYEAVQENLGKRVAVKVLHPHLANQALLVARFKREAESAARLGHENIVQVIDFGVDDDGTAFLVMEFLTGQPLSLALARDGRLPMPRIAFIAAQVLAALSSAHAAGIIHRDLKPDNIFLTSVAEVADIVKLLDFGIAKVAEDVATSKLTSTGAVLGTPQYMSPEQARGRVVDARSDLYALGVVIYEALTGRLPFVAENYNALMFAILEDTPQPLASLRSDLDPEFVRVVERAMAKRPEDRFESADAMRASLAPWTRVTKPGSAAPSAEAFTTALGTAPTLASPSLGSSSNPSRPQQSAPSADRYVNAANTPGGFLPLGTPVAFEAPAPPPSLITTRPRWMPRLSVIAFVVFATFVVNRRFFDSRRHRDDREEQRDERPSRTPAARIDPTEVPAVPRPPEPREITPAPPPARIDPPFAQPVEVAAALTRAPEPVAIVPRAPRQPAAPPVISRRVIVTGGMHNRLYETPSWSGYTQPRVAGLDRCVSRPDWVPLGPDPGIDLLLTLTPEGRVTSVRVRQQSNAPQQTPAVVRCIEDTARRFDMGPGRGGEVEVDIRVSPATR